MAGHCSGIAEAKINVVPAVDVGEVRTFCGLDKNREWARPFFHPVHGNAAEERVLCAAIESGGLRMIVDEALRFSLMKAGEFVGIDGGHCSAQVDIASTKLVDDFFGGVRTAGTGEPVARVRAGAAEVEPADRSFVASPIEDWAHREKLVQREFAVEDVSAGESVDRLEIARSDDLHRFDDLVEVRRISGNRFEH